MKQETIGLNKEQIEAKNTKEGNLLIIASAGTGKTTTIVERYVNLVKNKGYSQDEIMMTAFTNKAAKDMIDKISKRRDKLPVWMGTMHSLFLIILRENAGLILKNSNFTLITDDSEKKKIIKEMGKKEKDNNKVKISTIHSVKCLEWKYIFLACCNENILPYYKDKLTNIKRDSELRLFYVAISRVKERLYLTHSFRHKWQILEPSQFLEVIE